MSSTTRSYDAIVIGLGAMGSATVFHLAMSGKRVLGIDQFSPPHTFGSSHGDSRITRQAIGEGEVYVPFALRSHQLWRDIESKSGQKLLFQVGGLILGDPASTAIHHNKTGFLNGTIHAAERFGIPHEVLDAAAIRKRFTQFKISNNEIGYYEPGAGYVVPEECIRAQLMLAQRYGAELKVNQKVCDISSSSAGSVVSGNRSRGVQESSKTNKLVHSYPLEAAPGEAGFRAKHCKTQ